MTEQRISKVPPHRRGETSVESLDHLRSESDDSVLDNDWTPHSDQTVTELQRELDRTRIRLLTALDVVAGVEAEGGATEARMRELEHRHHMVKVERDELRREVERLSAATGGGLRHIVRLARSILRRTIG